MNGPYQWGIHGPLTYSPLMSNYLWALNGKCYNWPCIPHNDAPCIGNVIHSQYMGHYKGPYMGLSTVMAHAWPLAPVLLYMAS